MKRNHTIRFLALLIVLIPRIIFAIDLDVSLDESREFLIPGPTEISGNVVVRNILPGIYQIRINVQKGEFISEEVIDKSIPGGGFNGSYVEVPFSVDVPATEEAAGDEVIIRIAVVIVPGFPPDPDAEALAEFEELYDFIAIDQNGISSSEQFTATVTGTAIEVTTEEKTIESTNTPIGFENDEPFFIPDQRCTKSVCKQQEWFDDETHFTEYEYRLTVSITEGTNKVEHDGSEEISNAFLILWGRDELTGDNDKVIASISCATRSECEYSKDIDVSEEYVTTWEIRVSNPDPPSPVAATGKATLVEKGMTTETILMTPFSQIYSISESESPKDLGRFPVIFSPKHSGEPSDKSFSVKSSKPATVSVVFSDTNSSHTNSETAHLIATLIPDSDADGLNDFEEACIDGDCESYDPYDPLDNPSGTDTDKTKADTDGDGVNDKLDAHPIDPNRKSFNPIMCGDIGNLVHAIHVANTTSETDTIELNPTVSINFMPVKQIDCLYSLTDVAEEVLGPNGLPSITSNISIHGNGATIARSTVNDVVRPNENTIFRPEFRIFHVASSGTLSLSDVIIANGASGSESDESSNAHGGCIWNAGVLNLFQTTVRECNLTSRFGMGGGIYNHGGDVRIIASTMANNGATYGGGIASSGNLTMDQSTISGNGAFDGGGVYINGGEAECLHCTITRNVSGIDGSGIYIVAGRVSMANSVVSHNINNQTDGGNCRQDPDNNAIIVSSLGNVLPLEQGSETCLASNLELGFGEVWVDSDIPILSTLQNNGGATLTHEPLLNSPAIDQATSCIRFRDQRGILRKADGDGDGSRLCDIGAVEFYPIANDKVTENKNKRNVKTFKDRVSGGGDFGALQITAYFTNGPSEIRNPFFQVVTLETEGLDSSQQNVLSNADDGPGRVGAIRTPALEGDVWLANQEIKVEFVIGLHSDKRFRFFVDLRGEMTD